MQAEPLLSLAAQVAGEHQTADVLSAVVRGLAAQPGVALARVWLLSPGDLCESCFHRTDCADQTQCLHLVASAGSSKSVPGEDWSSLHGQYRRIPRGHRKVGEIGTTGRSILIPDAAATSEWIGNKEWAKRESIRGFAGYPLVSRGEILGVLATFNRECLRQQDFSWLEIFANQVAVAITNARAFEQIRRGENELRESETKYRSLVDLSPAAILVLSNDGKFVSANPAGLRLLKCSVSELEQISILDTYSKEDLAALSNTAREDQRRSLPVRAHVCWQRRKPSARGGLPFTDLPRGAPSCGTGHQRTQACRRSRCGSTRRSFSR